MAETNVPVTPGYDKPWLRELVTAADVHGESGLDGYAFSPLAPIASAVHAMQYLESVFVQADHPIDWIATGPLTNVGAFLLGHPHCRQNVQSLTLMGGSLRGGNITAQAEFNIYVDPEAAAYVLSSGLNIKMVGLDVTHKALLTYHAMERFRQLKSPIGEMLYALFIFYGAREPHANRRGMPIHDVLAVAALVHPTLFTWLSAPVEVKTCSGTDRGKTQIASSGVSIDVAVDIDVPGFFEWLWETLKFFQ
jgi:pyrimidine-specific ribonucleoside hydrolase